MTDVNISVPEPITISLNLEKARKPLSETLVVNLFGGPGTGKSTNCAMAFGLLKHGGVEVEIAPEYAKDLTWEERHKAIVYQPYVAVKQMWRVHRLLGKVQAIITDSPILLSAIYKGEGYTPSFESFLVDTFRSWRTLNIFLERDPETHPYVQSGRRQTEQEALALDDQIKQMLRHFEIPFETVRVSTDTADVIHDLIRERL